MALDDKTVKIVLDERDLPTHWYNVVPDLPSPPAPPLHPGTGQPLGPADLAPLFPMGIIMQEVSQEPRIEIPDQVRDIYRLWRPSPMHRARRLEKALDTPAHIYYKYEGVSPAGSHKPNTAIAQAYYNKQEGTKRLTTETGAGQWGTALSIACSMFDLEATVYMVKASYYQKPYRKSLIQAYGATIYASPSEQTNSGRKVLSESPDSPGSLGIAISEAAEDAAPPPASPGGLGIAISEAVEDAATHDDAHSSLGSVLNHVLLHQTVIGQESMKQLELAGEYPDVVIGCVGGGSNFAGISFPFIRGRLKQGKKTRFIAAEPLACPTLTKGVYTYDLGDTVGLTPLVKMHTLGHTFVPPAIHAGGLRYHGDAPLVCQLVHEGIIEAVAHPQTRVFEAAVQFARTEGIMPAPESAHAIRSAVDEALAARESGEQKVILFLLSGHGHFDMGAYDAFFPVVDTEIGRLGVMMANEGS